MIFQIFVEVSVVFCTEFWDHSSERNLLIPLVFPSVKSDLSFESETIVGWQAHLFAFSDKFSTQSRFNANLVSD